MSSFVKTEFSNAVAKVTLTRSELHNAFNDQMISELTSTFSELGKNPDVRAIILEAEGKSFCAGADLNWMKSMLDYTFEENVSDAGRLGQMLKTIDECPKPVIGRIHGAAFGGGIGLISVCDMTVAMESAVFCLSEVKLGLVPAVISPFVMQKVPVSQARRYFVTAERFSAEEAHRIGLISRVVPTQDIMDETIDEWINHILQNGPEAVTVCKKLIRALEQANREKYFDITTKCIAERRISAEGQEGMRSFLEKRQAKWIHTGSGSHVS